MGKKLIIFLKSIIIKLSISAKRFPVALLMATSTVFVLIYMNHLNYDTKSVMRETITRISMTLALGVPISLCIKMFFERVSNLKNMTKGVIYFISSILLVIYYLLLLKEPDMVAVTRYIAFTISFYLLFTYIPFIKKKENYELYIIKLITRFFITYLYSIVLFLGLSAILFTVDGLFNVNIPSRIYFDIWLMVVGVFAPAFFLGEIPYIGDELKLDDYPKVFKVLLLYIVMPLLTAYTVILYSYFIKVLITRQWPKGIISNLVLWYSVISTIIIFLINPLRKENQWANIFTRILPKSIFLLLGMMFVAIAIRINAYGITEKRYFVLIVGLWVTGCMIYFALSNKPRNTIIAISISLIAIMSVIGPLSSYSLSKHSQNNRFEKLVKQHGLLENGMIKPIENISKEARREIGEIVIYFNSNHSLKDLKYVPKDFEISQMEQVFGFPIYRENLNYTDYFHYNVEDNNIYDIREFDYFAYITAYGFRDGKPMQNEGVRIAYNDKTNELSIIKNDKVEFVKNLQDVALEINKNNQKQNLTKEEATYVIKDDKITVHLLFKSLSASKNVVTDEFSLQSFELNVFVKFKE